MSFHLRQGFRERRRTIKIANCFYGTLDHIPKPMILIPFEKYSLQTDLSRSQALIRLKKYLEPKQLIRIRALKTKVNKPYEGIIDGYKFTIVRIIGYGNSFVPTIIAEIKEEPRGSRIDIKMRPKKIVTALFVLLILFFTILTVIEPNPIIYIVILFFMYSLAMILFRIEARRAERDLKDVFKAFKQ